MPRQTTIGRLLLEDAVPEDLRPAIGTLDGAGLQNLLGLLAERHPDKYRDVVKRMSDVSRRVGYESGGLSFGPEDMAIGPQAHAVREQLRSKILQIMSDPSLDAKTRDDNIVKASLEHMDPILNAVRDEAVAAKNPLAMQMLSGAKGSGANIRALIAGDVLYTDQDYKPIPFPVLHSFGEGLRPSEYLAAAAAARKAIVTTKLSVADGGFLCLDVNTLVRMADGSSRPIKDIAVGDKVIGVSKSGEASPVSVTAVISTGFKQVYRHIFRPGRSRTGRIYIDATEDHKALFNVKSYWKTITSGESIYHRKDSLDVLPFSAAAESKKNANFMLYPVQKFSDTGLLNESRALLLGMLIGDGCLTYKSKVTLASGDADGMAALSGYFESMGLRADKKLSGYEYTLNSTQIPSGSGRRSVAGMGSVELRRWLSELGLVGHRAKDKFIPDEVWGWDNKSVAALIAGLFITDGCFSVSNQTGRPIVKFAMTSSRVISRLYELLSVRFGIVASSMWSQTNVQLANANMNAMARFNNRRPSLLNKSLALGANPIHSIIISNRTHLKRFAELLRQFDLNHDRATRFILAVDQMDRSDDDLSFGYSWVGREDLGIRLTMDIEVDHPDHLFLLSNGAVVSNSKRLNGVSHRLLVTAKDADDPHGGVRGLPYRLDHPDNEGAVLASEVGGHPRNTILTRSVIADLKRKGVKDVLLRSPLVGGPSDGGVYGMDVGVRERGGVAPRGDYVGLSAAAALSEPITQIMLCLVEGTEVRMADWSVKRIENIRIGDVVLGADKDGNTFPVRVVNRYDNGYRDCHRTEFWYGHRSERAVLESTLDHKILATTMMSSCKEEIFNGVKRQLPVGKTAKHFYAVAPGQFDDTGLAGDGRGLLMGLLLGDGCYTKSMGWNSYLSCADESLVRDLGPYLAGLNLRLVQTQAGNGLMYRLSQVVVSTGLRDGTTGRMLKGATNPARAMLQEMGMQDKYAHEKVIPDVVYGWDNASVAAVLAGLFITDGSVFLNKQSRYPHVNFASTSKRMVLQFAELLAWRFGIHCSPVRTNNSSRKRPLYSVLVSRYLDVQRLRSVLPLFGVKRETYDRLLAEAEIERAKLTSATHGCRTLGRLEAPYRLRRKLSKSIGVRRTYDIEVDHPDHLFVLANGLIISNSSKHGGGVAGASKTQAGFPTIERLFSIPQSFPGGATHAQRDGMVNAILESPQGGRDIIVDNEPHYAGPDLDPVVKVGDRVEAGDPLTDGIERPDEYVHHKGIGEARRRFLDIFDKQAKGLNLKYNRRNLELVARGLIDHVQMTDETDDHVPGDIVSYTSLEHGWQPRPGSRVDRPKHLEGQYLERPALHYTIGTRITPSVTKMLGDHGIDQVTAHASPPPFEPVMVRANDNLQNDPDWTTQMLGSGLYSSLLDSMARGATADPGGTSYVPALSQGVDFGAPGTKTRGWDRSDIVPVNTRA